MDIQYLLFLQNLRGNLPDFVSRFMMFVSDADLSLRCVLPLLLFWCVSKRTGAFVGFSIGFASVVNCIVKLTFCVYRPWIRSGAVLPYGNAKASAGGYSFPSGHSTIAASMYGAVGFEYKKRRWFFALMIFIALLTGFSRNYLGCHTPQDVAVGLCEGFLLMLAAEHFMDWIYAEQGRGKWVLIAAVVLIIASLLYIELKSYPMDFVDGKLIVDGEKMKSDYYSDSGLLLGTALGWLLERRFVKFSLNVSAWKKVLRFVAGSAAAVVIYKFGGDAILASGLPAKAAKFISHFLLMFYVYFIGPLVLQALDASGRRKNDGKMSEN